MRQYNLNDQVTFSAFHVLFEPFVIWLDPGHGQMCYGTKYLIIFRAKAYYCMDRESYTENT